MSENKKMKRQELMKELTKVQNHKMFQNQDIMTFTGFLNDQELVKYVADKKEMIA